MNEDEQTALMSDFGAVSNTALEDWALTDEKLEQRLSPPNALHAFTKVVTDQINFFGLAFRQGAKRNGVQPWCPS